MFETLFSRPAALKRHRQAPFAEERSAYLTHLVDRGTVSCDVRPLCAVGSRSGPEDHLEFLRWVTKTSRFWFGPGRVDAAGI